MADTKSNTSKSNTRKDDTPVFLLEIRKNCPKNPIIKLYQQKLSYEEKYKLGILTYPESVQWQQELMEQEKEKEKEIEKEPQAGEGSTFWSADGGNRDNISADDYNDFLEQNHIDVTNRTYVDFDSLKDQFND